MQEYLALQEEMQRLLRGHLKIVRELQEENLELKKRLVNAESTLSTGSSASST